MSITVIYSIVSKPLIQLALISTLLATEQNSGQSKTKRPHSNDSFVPKPLNFSVIEIYPHAISDLYNMSF